MSRRRQQPEAEIPKCVFEHFKIRSAPDVFAFHPANGGYRRPIEAKIFQGIGVRSGVPDIVAVRGGQMYCLELKAKGGRLTPAQVAAHSLLISAGAMVAMADNIDAALRQLESWSLLRGDGDKSTPLKLSGNGLLRWNMAGRQVLLPLPTPGL
jgi:hypothetical protein